MALLFTIFWIALALLAAYGGWTIVRRARPARRRGEPRVTDDVVRSIERGETVPGEEEPLDLDDIREEEKRFWDDWDEPEEWGA